VRIQQWMCCSETYPMLAVLRDGLTGLLTGVLLSDFCSKRKGEV
jgi:hypothetical protein